MRDLVLVIQIALCLLAALYLTSPGYQLRSGTDAEELIRLVGEVPPYAGCAVTHGGERQGTTELIVTRCWPQ